jgi:LPS O-antigen subunit length determinant protein (WzzB/FepE family)
MNDSTTQNSMGEKEIDLIILAKSIYNEKIVIVKFVFLFIFLGFLVAFLSPTTYSASSTFIPQTSESSTGAGSLGGLASLAGINLGNMGTNNDIPPTLYPKFLSSGKFKKALLQAPITIEGQSESITYAHYYEEIAQPNILEYVHMYTLGLPGLISKSFKSVPEETTLIAEGELIKFKPSEVTHFKRLENQVSVLINEKEGLVTLFFKMPEPLMAAQMAKYAQDLLQNEVISYKISNAREQLKFTEERYLEKQLEFKKIQTQLSYFRDRNQNIVSATAQNQLQLLEADYNFSFSIFTELAKQLEQAKLQVAKDTPIFSIIEPVTIPTQKSAPKQSLIIIIFAFVGLILSIFYIFGMKFFNEVRYRWEKG